MKLLISLLVAAITTLKATAASAQTYCSICGANSTMSFANKSLADLLAPLGSLGSMLPSLASTTNMNSSMSSTAASAASVTCSEIDALVSLLPSTGPDSCAASIDQYTMGILDLKKFCGCTGYASINSTCSICGAFPPLPNASLLGGSVSCKCAQALLSELSDGACSAARDYLVPFCCDAPRACDAVCGNDDMPTASIPGIGSCEQLTHLPAAACKQLSNVVNMGIDVPFLCQCPASKSPPGVCSICPSGQQVNPKGMLTFVLPNSTNATAAAAGSSYGIDTSSLAGMASMFANQQQPQLYCKDVNYFLESFLNVADCNAVKEMIVSATSNTTNDCCMPAMAPTAGGGGGANASSVAVDSDLAMAVSGAREHSAVLGSMTLAAAVMAFFG
jgi:hypothetical protein